MSRDYLDLGDWNAACAECGRKRKASELKLLPPGTPGAGLYVCPEHWEPRHPQEFVRGIPDKPAAPWSQQQSDTYVFDTIDTEAGSTDDFTLPDVILSESGDMLLTEGN